MEKRKILGLIVGITAFIALIAGITLAWLNWSSSTKITGGSGCFDITYTGQGFNGTLKMSSDYTGGILASATMKISDSCSGVTGTGTLNLHTNSFKAEDTNLLTASSALKYAVVIDDATTAAKTGTITSAGDLTVYNGFTIDGTSHTYKVYLWLDGATADSAYLGAAYSGYINASAKQNAS